MKLLKLFVGALLFVSTTTIASAETRITYKSAKSTSSYYQMAVEIAEAMKQGSSGDIIVTVEESQGSVQNVMEAIGRTNNYVFTTPPVLIKLARGGKAMFKDKTNPRFDDVKALFPIPSLTMHFVMSESSGVTDFAGMEGKTILIGKGSFGAKEGAKYLKKFGINDIIICSGYKSKQIEVYLKRNKNFGCQIEFLDFFMRIFLTIYCK